MFPMLTTTWDHSPIDPVPRLLDNNEYRTLKYNSGYIGRNVNVSQEQRDWLAYYEFLRWGIPGEIELDDTGRFFCSSPGHALLGALIGYVPALKNDMMILNVAVISEYVFYYIYLGLNGLYYYSRHDERTNVVTTREHRVYSLHRINFQLAQRLLYRPRSRRYVESEALIGNKNYLINDSRREFVDPTTVGLGLSPRNQMGIRGSFGDIWTILTTPLDEFQFDPSLLTDDSVREQLESVCGRWQGDTPDYLQHTLCRNSNRFVHTLWSDLQIGNASVLSERAVHQPPYVNISLLVNVALECLMGISVIPMPGISERSIVGPGLLWGGHSYTPTLTAPFQPFSTTARGPQWIASLPALQISASIHSRRRGRKVGRKTPVASKTSQKKL